MEPEHGLETLAPVTLGGAGEFLWRCDCGEDGVEPLESIARDRFEDHLREVGAG